MLDIKSYNLIGNGARQGDPVKGSVYTDLPFFFIWFLVVLLRIVALESRQSSNEQ